MSHHAFWPCVCLEHLQLLFRLVRTLRPAYIFHPSPADVTSNSTATAASHLTLFQVTQTASSEPTQQLNRTRVDVFFLCFDSLDQNSVSFDRARPKQAVFRCSRRKVLPRTIMTLSNLFIRQHDYYTKELHNRITFFIGKH